MSSLTEMLKTCSNTLCKFIFCDLIRVNPWIIYYILYDYALLKAQVNFNQAIHENAFIFINYLVSRISWFFPPEI